MCWCECWEGGGFYIFDNKTWHFHQEMKARVKQIENRRSITIWGVGSNRCQDSLAFLIVKFTSQLRQVLFAPCVYSENLIKIDTFVF